MMIYVKTIKNKHFLKGNEIEIFFNDINRKYYAGEEYGVICTKEEIENEIYILDKVERFYRKCGAMDI